MGEIRAGRIGHCRHWLMLSFCCNSVVTLTAHAKVDAGAAQLIISPRIEG